MRKSARELLGIVVLLLRLVIDEVRVAGWNVEIRLRIPLDEQPDDTNATAPQPSSRRRPRPRGRNDPKEAVSSNDRLRSLGGAGRRVLPTPPETGDQYPDDRAAIEKTASPLTAINGQAIITPPTGDPRAGSFILAEAWSHRAGGRQTHVSTMFPTSRIIGRSPRGGSLNRPMTGFFSSPDRVAETRQGLRNLRRGPGPWVRSDRDGRCRGPGPSSWVGQAAFCPRSSGNQRRI
jgi:hypothetical protein